MGFGGKVWAQSWNEFSKTSPWINRSFGFEILDWTIPASGTYSLISCWHNTKKKFWRTRAFSSLSSFLEETCSNCWVVTCMKAPQGNAITLTLMSSNTQPPNISVKRTQSVKSLHKTLYNKGSAPQKRKEKQSRKAYSIKFKTVARSLRRHADELI
jgi:hypothetical protein